MKVIAVVVTYNRKKLLMECLESLLSQTYPLTEIVVFDNASTDGTESALKESGVLNNKIIKYIGNETNIGGAGGFYSGSKQAYKDGAEWVWIMDDDCIPTETALEELINATKITEASFFCSAIYSVDGGVNIPPGVNPISFWYKYIAYGLVSVTWAAFVSFFINRKAIEKCGLPYKNYFIYGDDAEYSQRLIRYYGPGYLVGKSRVIHKSGSASSPWDSLEPLRIRRGHYLVRNKLVNIDAYGSFKEKIKKYILNLFFIMQLLFGRRKRRFLKIRQVIQGTWEYWVGNYDRKAFKQRFTNHLDDLNK